MIKTELEKITNNFIRATIGDVDFYFSYDTIIAFRINGKLYISENVWSKTTGKHLNAIYQDKTQRIPNKEFNSLLTKLHEKIMKSD